MLGYHHPPGADTPLEQTPTGADTPPWERTPLEQTPPHLAQSMLGDTVNARAVRILLECNLVLMLLVNQCARLFYSINKGINHPKSNEYNRLVQNIVPSK